MEFKPTDNTLQLKLMKGGGVNERVMWGMNIMV